MNSNGWFEYVDERLADLVIGALTLRQDTPHILNRSICLSAGNSDCILASFGVH